MCVFRVLLENDEKQLLWRVNCTQLRDPGSTTFVSLTEESTSKILRQINQFSRKINYHGSCVERAVVKPGEKFGPFCGFPPR